MAAFVLIVYDELYSRHLRGTGHPEAPDRVEGVLEFLRGRGIHLQSVAPRDATRAEIERVHGERYLTLVEREVQALQQRAGYLSTGDTAIDRSSFAVAMRAAGGAVAAAEAAYERKTAAFAVVRPPGHHAEPARGMGFCLLNNAAVCARAVQASIGGRVLVADFDYHHGNGTQAIAGNGVSYVSTHGFPAYPGTGGPQENYVLEGGDVIVNLPLPPHDFGTEAFVAAWQRLLPSVARRTRPDMLVVSAGFDYAAGDPVGDLGVDPRAAGDLGTLVREVAAEWCEGRVAYVLEGGYDPKTVRESIALIAEAHDAEELRVQHAEAAAIPPRQTAILGRIQEIIKESSA